MKQVIIVINVALFSIIHCYAQNDIIEVTISRTDHSSFYVTDAKNDSTLLTFEDQNRVLIQDLVYKIIPGTGRKKDPKGDREKHKEYLVNSIGDTLLTLREKQKTIELNDSISVYRQRTENGWIYLDSNNHLVSEIILSWNEQEWSFILYYYHSGQAIEYLKKIHMLSLVRMAKYRSKLNCNSCDNDFWFTMAVISILNQNC